MILNLVENIWLKRHPRPMEITYERYKNVLTMDSKIPLLNLNIESRLKKVCDRIHHITLYQKE